jgi:hypothetical protein
MDIPPAKNADGASNFVISANNRINFALLRQGRQVDSIFLESIEALFSCLRFYASVTAYLLDGSLEGGLG